MKSSDTTNAARALAAGAPERRGHGHDENHFITTHAKAILRFRGFVAAALVCTIAVILWGAFVRATGSGAGCGSHWPLCNGQVLPRSPQSATIIEFTHRLTSGAAFSLVAIQLFWAFRLFRRGDQVRRAAVASMILMITEALIGAGLVLFKMVASNESIARGFWMLGHLLNTFALLAALALTLWRAHAATSAEQTTSPLGRGRVHMLRAALAGVILVAMSGAVAALGDTLFPASSLADGFRQDFSSSAHAFVALRIWHPVLAVAVGFLLMLLLPSLRARLPATPGFALARRLATACFALVAAQLAAGVINLVLLAPVPLQLIHLLLADLLWLGLVWLLLAVSSPARVIQNRSE